MAKFRLATVFRARQVQEEAAKADVVRANSRTRAAEQVARQYAARLGESTVPDAGVAQAILATMAARRSMAASLAAAYEAVAVAEQHTIGMVAELGEAAKRRKAVEMLADRHAEEMKREFLATDQRMIDELAVTGGQRAAAREVNA